MNIKEKYQNDLNQKMLSTEFKKNLAEIMLEKYENESDNDTYEDFSDEIFDTSAYSDENNEFFNPEIIQKKHTTVKILRYIASSAAAVILAVSSVLIIKSGVPDKENDTSDTPEYTTLTETQMLTDTTAAVTTTTSSAVTTTTITTSVSETSISNTTAASSETTAEKSVYEQHITHQQTDTKVSAVTVPVQITENHNPVPPVTSSPSVTESRKTEAPVIPVPEVSETKKSQSPSIPPSVTQTTKTTETVSETTITTTSSEPEKTEETTVSPEPPEEGYIGFFIKTVNREDGLTDVYVSCRSAEKLSSAIINVDFDINKFEIEDSFIPAYLDEDDAYCITSYEQTDILFFDIQNHDLNGKDLYCITLRTRENTPPGTYKINLMGFKGDDKADAGCIITDKETGKQEFAELYPEYTSGYITVN